MEKRKLEEDLGERRALVPATAPDLHYTSKTGLCYDVRFRYHSRINFTPDNYLDPHPEDPRRTFRIYKTLAEHGLIVDEFLSGAQELGALMEKVDAKEATSQQLLLVHSQEHLNFIASLEQMSNEALLNETERGDSIYVNTDSFLTAKLSCGGAIESCRAVVEKRVKNSLAVIRPPGHHAEPETPGGFCLFSNVAVAAKVMLEDYPESVKRIVILDWDIHHGNGTQKAFLDDPRVLYISIHRYQNGTFYPGTKEGGADKVGTNEGRGYNVNIPWSAKGMTDGDYISVMYRLVLPLCDEFDPDLVIISSGFDAADGDPIGQCHVSPAGYAYMTHLMKLFCDGKLVVCLEGGYNLDSISVSALAVTKVLLGEPPSRPTTTVASKSAIQTIDQVMRVQSQFWKCMGPSHPEPVPDETARNVEALYEVLRNYEAAHFRSTFGLSELPLSSRELELHPNQVLCTPDIYNAKNLLVLVHGAPSIWASKDPLTGLVDTTDGAVWSPSFKYLEWAQTRSKVAQEWNKAHPDQLPRNAEDYGVVDIFFPAEEVTIRHDLPDAQDVLAHIWDTAIRHFAATNICFIGFGACYNSLVYLAGHRQIKHRTEAIVAYLCNDQLKQIVPALEESAVDWFWKSSLIFTNQNHRCWDNLSSAMGPKRPRKRMGRVLRCDADNMFDMVEEKFKETEEFMLDV